MSVTSLDKDFDQMNLTLIADFDAPVERVWQLWADPRQLERWWGPPGYPATMETHELTPGGSVNYYMTSPTGDKHHGWWQITAVNPPRSLEFEDGFADDQGNRVTDLPEMKITMQLTDYQGGTRMEMRSIFNSREDMDKLIEMGMDEGLRVSVGQMDDLLAA